MLRAMFPRPYCIHSEGALDKSIYLLQPAEQLEEGVTEADLFSESVCMSQLISKFKCILVGIHCMV